jgi:transposase
MTLEMIRELEVAREQAMEAHDNPANQTVKALCKLRGLGDNFSAILAKEVFYRTFDNRRQIAAYLGLAPTPFQSGGMDRDRRINRAGNGRARKTMVQLASAGKRPGAMVSRTRRGTSRAHAQNRDHRAGPQTAHRNLAVRHRGRRSGGRHPRSVKFDRRDPATDWTT